MAKEKICGIYKITAKHNNKIYIGQSIDIYARWKSHWKETRYGSNTPLHNTMRKYGKEDFDFEIIEECQQKDINEREIYWINFYNSYNEGFNLTTGGEGVKNKVFTNEEKEKYRMISTGKNKPILQFDYNGELLNEWFGVLEASKKLDLNATVILACLTNRANCCTAYGFIWIYKSSYKDINSLKLKERLASISNNKIYQIDINNNVVNIYNSMNDLLNKNKKYKAVSIYNSNSRNKPCYNYVWKLYKNYDLDFNYSLCFVKKSNSKPINQYDLQGNFIQSFKSIKDAGEILKINDCDIVAMLKGRQKTAHGFVWEYA